MFNPDTQVSLDISAELTPLANDSQGTNLYLVPISVCGQLRQVCGYSGVPTIKTYSKYITEALLLKVV